MKAYFVFSLLAYRNENAKNEGRHLAFVHHSLTPCKKQPLKLGDLL
jgi:hypothetical protein